MTHFILTDEHRILLRVMNWQRQRNYHGAPGVDDKRPFGFSGALHYDMCQKLGWVYDEGDEEQAEELDRLWSELLTALMVGLATGSFAPGEYVREGQSDWRRVETVDAPLGPAP